MADAEPAPFLAVASGRASKTITHAQPTVVLCVRARVCRECDGGGWVGRGVFWGVPRGESACHRDVYATVWTTIVRWRVKYGCVLSGREIDLRAAYTVLCLYAYGIYFCSCLYYFILCNTAICASPKSMEAISPYAPFQACSEWLGA